MADVFSSEKRSQIMRAIKPRNNKSTEEKLIKYFRSEKITGWRRNYPIKGKPDFVFLKPKVAVFADGCFWHGHDCRNTRPEQNKDYWIKKREKNMRRDTEVTSYLAAKNWHVIRIWECEIKKGDFTKLNHPSIQK